MRKLPCCFKTLSNMGMQWLKVCRQHLQKKLQQKLQGFHKKARNGLMTLMCAQLGKQGTLRLSLPLQFIQPNISIMQYFTYEGRYTYLHGIHFKNVSHLQHENRPVSFPSYIFNIIKKQATLVQSSKDQSVSHHCLIRATME